MTRHDPAEAGPNPREYVEHTAPRGHSTDPETIAAEIIETFGPRDAVTIAEAIGEHTTRRGRHLLIPAHPVAAALTLADRIEGSRTVAVMWCRDVLEALGHPVPTEHEARLLVERVDDHERRISALERRVDRLETRLGEVAA